MDEEQRNKAHKTKVVGNKAAKKDEIRKKRAGIDLEPNRGQNIKAFQGPSAGSRKAQKFFRSLEKRESALHVPTLDKTFSHIESEPPLLVAVVGPPGVGKTTLIRSMVKFYANRTIQTLRGPVTVVAGRSRRVTFLECPNTLTAMCDVAKVADLILLMVDGSFGFEMETFEFLNIAQVHGFPKIFGIVSHLDQLKTGKALKKRKKFLRHRFWHEVAAGAKLLCLAPMVRGLYRPTDVLNLHRLLICVEPKVQAWRNTHSCVLIDRQEDITDPEHVTANPSCNRTIAFYGYTRGKPMKADQLVHIPGLGDYPVDHLSHQEDPCQVDRPGEGKSQGHRMRHLSMKQKKLYAPYSDVGGITYDDDAVYVQEDAEKGWIERSGEGVQLLRELQRAEPMDAAKTKLEVVRRPVVFRDEDTMELEMDEVRMPSDSEADSGNDDDDGDEYNDDDAAASGVKGKRSLSHTLDEFGLPEERANGATDSDGGDLMDGEDGELAPRTRNAPDAIRINTVAHDWSDEQLIRRLKDLFVTGNWDAGTATAAGEDGDDVASETHSKGYDSNDEEFEAEARGDKPLTRKRYSHDSSASDASGDADKADVKSESDEDEFDVDPVQFALSSSTSSSAAKTAHSADALASVGYSTGRSGASGGAVADPAGRGGGASSSSSWGAFRSGQQNSAGGAGGGSGGKRGLSGRAGRRGEAGKGGEDSSGEDDDDYDGYDILAEEESGSDGEGGNRAHGNGRGGEDAELDDLVASFLSKERGGGVAGSFPSARADEADLLKGDAGIEFYDAKAHLRRGDSDDADDAEERAAIVQGGQLSEEQEELLKKKMAKKAAFNEEYDTTGGVSTGKNMTYSYYHQLHRKVEEKKERLDAALDDVGDDLEKKIQLVGYFSGLYVRFVLSDIPVEYLRNFDPIVPLIAGGVNAGEDEFRVVHARIKRHRWFPKVLKAQDPVLLSMGWRRFQTQPIFATEDPNGRCRYLKYTPLHMHCLATFYAPVAPTNTGFLAIPVRNTRTPGFRISCTGYTVGNDVVSSVVKKLKLTGTPAKIEKTTVFVKGMFSSDVEAAKFVGAKLKSVSGIRGIIKSVLKGKQGLVRATFEDKIFPSDIVFIRAWKSVEPPQFCSIQRNLLDPNWVGMRTMRELRWDYGVPLPDNKDSEYREIKRRHRVADENEDLASQQVLISRSTRMQLPYDMKEEFIPLAKTTAMRERVAGAVTVAPEVREQRRQALLDAFAERADVMTKKKDEAKKRARAKAEREAEKENEKYLEGLKKAKKETARRNEFRSQHKVRKH